MPASECEVDCMAAAIAICILVGPEDDATFDNVLAHIDNVKKSLELPNAVVVALVMFAQQIIIKSASSWRLSIALGALFACKMLLDERVFTGDLVGVVGFSCDQLLQAERVAFANELVTFNDLESRLYAFRTAMVEVVLREHHLLAPAIFIPRQCNILVVDNDYEARRSNLALFIQANPHAEVRAVGTAMEAIKCIRNHRPDLLVLEADLREGSKPTLDISAARQLLDLPNSGYAVHSALREMEEKELSSDMDEGATLVAIVTGAAAVVDVEKDEGGRGIPTVAKPLTLEIARALQAMCWSYCLSQPESSSVPLVLPALPEPSGLILASAETDPVHLGSVPSSNETVLPAQLPKPNEHAPSNSPRIPCRSSAPLPRSMTPSALKLCSPVTWTCQQLPSSRSLPALSM
mmetsp:Transcript_60595/g.100614  ORF Transcript_60595/g.100614 Transcript_60595/m.100614 type:complete len:407 (+) Transcript_60595:56-1276(+)|eukprot:CAMPEP_0119298176 /NCGR_PEP_ID=MMETSP1333-20130426/379_1 /TAXON_ID=418940 /ORGANISM="Scyphosphaera apsteinii, Strain RCC1455" /LENGTH=406 /DNA_ID=CAMNT_0007299211 /DNA_START=52 /DNA_END=1272 /DNA_ORIENTATION=-